MTWPIVELTFWNPGDGHNPRIDPLLADPTTPLAKHGLTGIATAYARETGVAMHDIHRGWAEQIATRSLAVDGALGDVVHLLDRQGIRYFVAKGPVVAYTAYLHPAMRTYCDLDVYVAGDDHAAARALLDGDGFTAVPQATGLLGGLPQEMHGGRFGCTVELHAHVVDNMQRHHLPAIDTYLPHVERRRILGLDVPVLRPEAHLALQAIHAGAGHRYAKVSLLRDVELFLHRADDVPAGLGADAYLAVLVGILRRFGRPVPAYPHHGTLGKPVVRTLTKRDPVTWDEYSISAGNVLALLHQDRWSATARTLTAVRGIAAPGRDRRVELRRRTSGTTAPPITPAFSTRETP